MASIDGGNYSGLGQNPAGPGVPQPAWSGAGGGPGAAAVYAWQALYNQLGYAPTAAQLAQAAPSFMGTDPNIANVSGGDQFVSQMVQQLNAQSPQGAQQTAQNNANLLNQDVGANYANLMPTLQSQYLDPLNQAIQQQSGVQQGLANQTMGQQQGLTNQALGQNRQMTGQALMGQQGINQQSIGQQQGLEDQMLGQLQGVDQNQMQDLMTQLGPNGQLGQQMMGEFANYGLTPNSGGFQEGISNTMGNLASSEQQQLANAVGTGYGNVAGAAQTGSNDLSSILGQGLSGGQNIAGQGLGSQLGTSGQNYTTQSNLGLGGLSAEQSALQQPLTEGINQYNTQTGQQNALQNLLTQQGFNQNDFNQQSTLAQLLAQQGSPSGLQSALGMASGGAQGAGSLLQGGASAYKATWICSQLKKEGLLNDSHIKALHDHLYRAFWKRPMKFIGYLLFGRFLVYLANKYNTDWRVWKSEFYDDVMAEPDPVRAADLYADTFWKLYLNVTAKEYARKGMVG